MKDILTKPMFTGIVEEVGIVQLVDRLPQSARIEIEAKKTLENSKIGDSIAVNGACLTVTNLTMDRFNADISTETLRLTNLGNLKVGAPVNLERSVRLVDRVNGHLVQGHVDEVGKIIGWKDEGDSSLMRVSISLKSMPYIVYKGSITVDGVSLTIANLLDDSFEISLIPHTKEVTTMGQKQIEDQVNIEVDLIGRYIERLLTSKAQTNQSSS